MTAENVFQKKNWKIKTRTFPGTYSKKERQENTGKQKIKEVENKSKRFNIRLTEGPQREDRK